MILLRLINAVLALGLLWMAALQFNDPDSIMWITVYLIAALFAALTALGTSMPLLIGLFTVLCLGWSLWLSPNVPVWLANHPIEFITHPDSVKHEYMEKSRECLGLLMAVVCLFVSWITARQLRARSGRLI